MSGAGGGCCCTCCFVFLAVVAAFCALLAGLSDEYTLRHTRDITVPINLRKQGALVTGSSSGIGLEAAKELCMLGAHVIVHGSDQKRTADAASVVRQFGVGGYGLATPVHADLGDFDEVRRLVVDIKASLPTTPLNLVLLNAARAYRIAYLTEEERRKLWKRPASDFKAKSGHDKLIATNHLGHFLLMHHLAPKLAPAAKIVVMVSHSMWHAKFDRIMLDPAQRFKWEANRDTAWWAYHESKLANLCYGRALRKRRGQFKNATVIIHDPGYVQSNMVKVRDENCNGPDWVCYKAPSSGSWQDPNLKRWHAPTEEGGRRFVEAAYVHGRPEPDVVGSYFLPPFWTWWYAKRKLPVLGDMANFRISHTLLSEFFLDYEWFSWGKLYVQEGPECTEEFEDQLWEWSMQAAEVREPLPKPLPKPKPAAKKPAPPAAGKGRA